MTEPSFTKLSLPPATPGPWLDNKFFQLFHDPIIVGILYSGQSQKLKKNANKNKNYKTIFWGVEFQYFNLSALNMLTSQIWEANLINLSVGK